MKKSVHEIIKKLIDETKQDLEIGERIVKKLENGTIHTNNLSETLELVRKTNSRCGYCIRELGKLLEN